MKQRLIIFFVFVISLVIFNSCKKKAGPGGKNTISGKVLYKNGAAGNNDPAPLAMVYIAYGTEEATADFDQTILTDSEGKFKIEGLNKGKYFITAGYTDAHGFSYAGPGYGINIQNRKKNIELNIVLE